MPNEPLEAESASEWCSCACGECSRSRSCQSVRPPLGIYQEDAFAFVGYGDEGGADQWLPRDDPWRDNEPTGKPHRGFPCYWLWRAIVVNSNGQLGRCPGESNVHQLGDIRDRPIMSIYNVSNDPAGKAVILQATRAGLAIFHCPARYAIISPATVYRERDWPIGKLSSDATSRISLPVAQ